MGEVERNMLFCVCFFQMPSEVNAARGSEVMLEDVGFEVLLGFGYSCYLRQNIYLESLPVCVSSLKPHFKWVSVWEELSSSPAGGMPALLTHFSWPSGLPMLALFRGPWDSIHLDRLPPALHLCPCGVTQGLCCFRTCSAFPKTWCSALRGFTN